MKAGEQKGHLVHNNMYHLYSKLLSQNKMTKTTGIGQTDSAGKSTSTCDRQADRHTHTWTGRNRLHSACVYNVEM